MEKYLLLRRWMLALLTPRRPDTTLRNFLRYLNNWKIYSKLDGANNKISFKDSYPELFDNSETTSFDFHYVYQSTWALELINKNIPKFHVDIGSQIQFIASLAVFVPTLFIDIRPISSQIKGLTNIAGNILNLPFANNAVTSLSCLHVAEHIGLGRYGDPLNPAGTELACKELKRVLSLGGNLFFSIPIGVPKVCFNAHRIHSVEHILNYFDGLQLINLSAVLDNGQFESKPNWTDLNHQKYGCGLFWFQKPLI